MPAMHPYRFVFRIQKAKELAAQTRELGALLLSAFEKGDAEFLASVRARHDRELAISISRSARTHGVTQTGRCRRWETEAQPAGEPALLRQPHRQWAQRQRKRLCREHGRVDGRTHRGEYLRRVAEAIAMSPDLFVGTVDFAQIPVGTKLAGIFKTVARISNTLADISSTSARST